MSYVFPAPARPILAVVGSVDVFPIHRIYCVGRNYADHAMEMGHDPNREQPFFFQKNPDSILPSGGKFRYPEKTAEVHHEIELVVGLDRGGTNINASEAIELIYGYAVGLDMTRRDLQAKLKAKGRPWEIGKAFDNAAPCSAILQAKEIGHPSEGRICLEKNGMICQNGDLADMIWKVPEIISFLSGFFSLLPGDLIFTGTPAGVGPVSRGDSLCGFIEGIGELDIKVI
jgi:fumarylpyruvate hydrolase